jgi:uncharacterized membrane protein
MGSSADGDTSIAGEPIVTKLFRRIGLARFFNFEAFSSDRTFLLRFALLVIFIEVVVLQGYNLLTGRVVVFAENPLWFVRPFTLILSAIATNFLYTRYEHAVTRSQLLDRADSSDSFQDLVPDNLSALIISISLIFALVNAVFFLTIPQIYSAGGPARVFRFLITTPFGYAPILGTFLATYTAIEVLTPFRIYHSDVNVDFLDPEKLGGMRPIGELLKYAYYYVMIGLIAYAVGTYGPFVLGGVFAYTELSPPGSTVNVLFTAVWVFVVGMMVIGIYQLHRFMRKEKQQERDRLERQAQNELDEPYDIQRLDMTDLSDEYQAYRRKLEFVTSTREYPATFTMWSQLLVGVLIPKVLQSALAAL